MSRRDIGGDNETRTLIAFSALRNVVNLRYCKRIVTSTRNRYIRREMDASNFDQCNSFLKRAERLRPALASASVSFIRESVSLRSKSGPRFGNEITGLKSGHASCLFFSQKQPISCNLLARAGRGSDHRDTLVGNCDVCH